MTIACGTCGAYLSHINAVCDHCLPNFGTRATPEPVAPVYDPMVRLADVIAVIDDNQYALERVPVGWNLLVKIRAGVNALPVAPTPSPDIAKLVDRANEEAAYIDSARGYTGPLSTPTTLRDLATALQRVTQERDALMNVLSITPMPFREGRFIIADASNGWSYPTAEAYKAAAKEARGGAVEATHEPVAPPSPEALEANLKDPEFVRLNWLRGGINAEFIIAAERRAVEARIATARDEGREEVAEWLHQNGNITLAAGIRALKDQPR